MSKKRILTLGITMGLFLSMGIQAFAGSALEKIEAYINNAITFTINGEDKELPEDYEILTYNNRTYVPIRFIAETLGAKVDWNERTKNITITGRNTSEIPKYDYRELPLYRENSHFKMSVIMFTEDEHGRKFNITLENKEDDPIQLDQLQTIVEVDGIEYPMKNASTLWLDQRWFNDIDKEELVEGYIRLPNDIDYEELEDIHLVFKVRTNGTYTQRTDEMEFNIAL